MQVEATLCTFMIHNNVTQLSTVSACVRKLYRCFRWIFVAPLPVQRLLLFSACVPGKEIGHLADYICARRSDLRSGSARRAPKRTNDRVRLRAIDENRIGTYIGRPAARVKTSAFNKTSRPNSHHRIARNNPASRDNIFFSGARNGSCVTACGMQVHPSPRTDSVVRERPEGIVMTAQL